MKEELVRLLALYEVDKKIDEIKALKITIPNRIKELETEKEDIQKSVQEFIESIKHTEIVLKKKELDLAAAEERLRKHQEQLPTLKSNEEYRAMIKQIELDKEEISRLEDEALQIMDSLDRMKEQRPQVEAEGEARIREIEKQIKELKEQLSGIDEEVRLLIAERERRAHFVPDKIRRKYEKIRSLGKKNAVVPIIDGACGGCHADIPIQTINEIRASGTVAICENCGRLIYWPYDEPERD